MSIVVNNVHMLVLDVDASIGARVRLEGGSRYRSSEKLLRTIGQEDHRSLNIQQAVHSDAVGTLVSHSILQFVFLSQTLRASRGCSEQWRVQHNASRAFATTSLFRWN
jgi:hypothetical protein